MVRKDLVPTDPPDSGGWYSGRSVSVVQDPDWSVARVPSHEDRPWEIWYARLIYPYRQFLRFQLWATKSLYRLGFVVGSAWIIWSMIHSFK